MGADIKRLKYVQSKLETQYYNEFIDKSRYVRLKEIKESDLPNKPKLIRSVLKEVNIEKDAAECLLNLVGKYITAAIKEDIDKKG